MDIRIGESSKPGGGQNSASSKKFQLLSTAKQVKTRTRQKGNADHDLETVMFNHGVVNRRGMTISKQHKSLIKPMHINCLRQDNKTVVGLYPTDRSIVQQLEEHRRKQTKTVMHLELETQMDDGMDSAKKQLLLEARQSSVQSKLLTVGQFS